MTRDQAARIVRQHTPGRPMSRDAMIETDEAHAIVLGGLSPEDAEARAKQFRATLDAAQGGTRAA